MADVRACEILPDLGSFHPTTQVRVVDATELIRVQRGQILPHAGHGIAPQRFGPGLLNAQ